MTFVLPTYTWGQDREQCKRCKHYRERRDDPRHHSAALVMLCAINPAKSKRGIGTCIDMRTRGKCGRDAKLFAPAEDYRPLSDVAVQQGAAQRSSAVVPIESARSVEL